MYLSFSARTSIVLLIYVIEDEIHHYKFNKMTQGKSLI